MGETKVKQDVLKGIVKLMGKMSADKLKPKEKKVEAKPEEGKKKKEDVTPEMLEKLRTMYADKDKDSSKTEE